MYFQSQSEGLRTRRDDGVSSSSNSSRLETQDEPVLQFKSKGGKRPMSQLSSEAGIPSFQPYCSSQVFRWLDEAPPTLRRAATLLSLLIQTLISPRNTWTDTPRITFDQMSGHPMAQSSWHIKGTITGTYQGSYLSAFKFGDSMTQSSTLSSTLNSVTNSLCDPRYVSQSPCLPLFIPVKWGSWILWLTRSLPP